MSRMVAGDGRRRQRAAAIAIGAQRVERHGAHRRLVGVGQAAVGLAGQRPLRPDRPAQETRVAGEMDDRHQQRRHAGVLERRGEKGVVFGDRFVAELLRHQAPLRRVPAKSPITFGSLGHPLTGDAIDGGRRTVGAGAGRG